MLVDAGHPVYVLMDTLWSRSWLHPLQPRYLGSRWVFLAVIRHQNNSVAEFADIVTLPFHISLLIQRQFMRKELPSFQVPQIKNAVVGYSRRPFTRMQRIEIRKRAVRWGISASHYPLFFFHFPLLGFRYIDFFQKLIDVVSARFLLYESFCLLYFMLELFDVSMPELLLRWSSFLP